MEARGAVVNRGTTVVGNRYVDGEEDAPRDAFLAMAERLPFEFRSAFHGMIDAMDEAQAEANSAHARLAVLGTMLDKRADAARRQGLELAMRDDLIKELRRRLDSMRGSRAYERKLRFAALDAIAWAGRILRALAAGEEMVGGQPAKSQIARFLKLHAKRERAEVKP